MSRKQEAIQKYNAAKQRLGVADKPKAESQTQAVDEAPVMDENIVLDDDGFLVGVKCRLRRLSEGVGC